MAKLCPRGKAAAKRKFKVYPSAYANMYASAVCSGKVTPGGKKKRKKAMGGGMMDKRMGLKFGGPKPLETKMDKKKADQTKNVKKLMTQPSAYDPEKRFIKGTKKIRGGSINFVRSTTDQVNLKDALKEAKKDNPGFNVRIMKPEDMPRRRRKKVYASGGRIGLRAGSKGCKLAMKGKGKAYGKNS